MAFDVNLSNLNKFQHTDAKSIYIKSAKTNKMTTKKNTLRSRFCHTRQASSLEARMECTKSEILWENFITAQKKKKKKRKRNRHIPCTEDKGIFSIYYQYLPAWEDAGFALYLRMYPERHEYHIKCLKSPLVYIL